MSLFILMALNILKLGFTKLTLNTLKVTVECVSQINLTAFDILTLGFTKLTLNLTLNTLTVTV